MSTPTVLRSGFEALNFKVVSLTSYINPVKKRVKKKTK